MYMHCNKERQSKTKRSKTDVVYAVSTTCFEKNSMIGRIFKIFFYCSCNVVVRFCEKDSTKVIPG